MDKLIENAMFYWGKLNYKKRWITVGAAALILVAKLFDVIDQETYELLMQIDTIAFGGAMADAMRKLDTKKK